MDHTVDIRQLRERASHFQYNALMEEKLKEVNKFERENKAPYFSDMVMSGLPMGHELWRLQEYMNMKSIYEYENCNNPSKLSDKYTDMEKIRAICKINSNLYMINLN
jgi:hypothetical protein